MSLTHKCSELLKANCKTCNNGNVIRSVPRTASHDDNENSIKNGINSSNALLFLRFLPRPSPPLCENRYVWKLVYMFMLGYEIDFGHMEMICLIGSTK